MNLYPFINLIFQIISNLFRKTVSQLVDILVDLISILCDSTFLKFDLLLHIGDHLRLIEFIGIDISLKATIKLSISRVYVLRDSLWEIL